MLHLPGMQPVLTVPLLRSSAQHRLQSESPHTGPEATIARQIVSVARAGTVMFTPTRRREHHEERIETSLQAQRSRADQVRQLLTLLRLKHGVDLTQGLQHGLTQSMGAGDAQIASLGRLRLVERVA